jgi:hypothetical protein
VAEVLSGERWAEITDSVQDYCREQAETVYEIAGEYMDQGDSDQAQVYYGQAQAFREVARFIDQEVGR